MQAISCTMRLPSSSPPTRCNFASVCCHSATCCETGILVSACYSLPVVLRAFAMIKISTTFRHYRTSIVLSRWPDPVLREIRLTHFVVDFHTFNSSAFGEIMMRLLRVGRRCARANSRLAAACSSPSCASIMTTR